MLIAAVWIITAFVWLDPNPVNAPIREPIQRAVHYEEYTTEYIDLDEDFTICETTEMETKAEFIAYEDVPLPEDIQIHMQQVCEEYSICYEFALALMESESSFKEDAVGDGGNSIGYMQINRCNWNWMKEEYGLDVSDPKDNITAGIVIMSIYFEKYQDPYRTIILYKAGETRGNELYEKGLFKTNDYDCEAICKRAQELEQAHHKGIHR